MIVLTAVKHFEAKLRQDRLATLSVIVAEAGPAEEDVRARLMHGPFAIKTYSTVYDVQAGTREMKCDVIWRAKSSETNVPEQIRAIAVQPGIIRIAWTPHVN